MRKLLIAVVALLGLPGLVLPGLVGIALAAFWEQSGGDPAWPVEVRRLERGWFASDLQLAIRRSDQPPLIIGGRAKHGPWGLAWLRGSAQVQASDGAPALAGLDYRLGFTGNLEARLAPTPALGRGHLTLTATDNWQRWRFAPKDLGIDRVVTALNGSVTLRMSGLLSGELAAERLQLAPGSVLSGATLRLGAELRDDVLGLDLGGTAGALSHAGEQWRNLSLDLVLHRLHAPTLARLVRVLGQVPPGQAAPVLVTALGPLLLFSPVLEHLAVAGLSPHEGTFEARAAARFLTPPSADFIGDFSRLLGVLALEAELRADAPLARSWIDAALTDPRAPVPLEERTRALVADGILVPEGDGYRMRVDYEPGRLRVNGRPRSVPIELGTAPSQPVENADEHPEDSRSGPSQVESSSPIRSPGAI